MPHKRFANFLTSLLAPRTDPHQSVRALWHQVIALARIPSWYREGAIADTVVGRFDTITLVLSLVLIRMETNQVLMKSSALLTEMFVDDMDGQLREVGVGDLVVGKHIGKLMGALGGRLGALREALASTDANDLVAMIERNVSMGEASQGTVDANIVAGMIRSLMQSLVAMDDSALLSGEIRWPTRTRPATDTTTTTTTTTHTGPAQNDTKALKC